MSASRALDAVTLEVAGLACRIECALPKPILWVTELHPAFRSTRDPDTIVTVRYDDGYWDRDLPWIAPDQLRDAPVYAEAVDGTAVLRSTYYEARMDSARAHVVVDMATGFGVGAMLRALYATMLPRRGACLVSGTIQPLGDGAMLALGGEDGAVALVDGGRGIEVEPTPFHAGTSPTRPPRYRASAMTVAGAAGGVDAAARVLARTITVDHGSATLERVLDLVTRFVAEVPSLATGVDVAGIGVSG